MSEEVSLEIRVKIDALVREIAKRDYPPVFCGRGALRRGKLYVVA